MTKFVAHRISDMIEEPGLDDLLDDSENENLFCSAMECTPLKGLPAKEEDVLSPEKLQSEVCAAVVHRVKLIREDEKVG